MRPILPFCILSSAYWVLPGCAVLAQPTPGFDVRVVYLIPRDQERFPEYERAIERCVDEVKSWYRAKAGVTFRTRPLEVVRAEADYLTMRCGDDPAERANGEKDVRHMPRWVESVERACGGWQARTVTWVFAQGGGGVAVANLQGDFAGFGMFGDWVLEPISGVTNPKGVTAAMCERKIYVTGGTPVGTTVHELGHAFGLHHPDGYAPGEKTIMLAHWEYPKTSLLEHELLVLRHSPFTARDCWDEGAPFVDYLCDDAVAWGRELAIPGRGFADGDVVEFVDVAGAHRVTPSRVTGDRVVVAVPRVGPGVVRVRRGALRSNAIPINVYEKLPK
jgi:hypothetical protein